MVRPHLRRTKEKINLTISKDALEKGKKVAVKENKSLSQFTEDMYVGVHNDYFGIIENPMEKLKEVEKRIEVLKKNMTKHELTLNKMISKKGDVSSGFALQEEIKEDNPPLNK